MHVKARECDITIAANTKTTLMFAKINSLSLKTMLTRR